MTTNKRMTRFFSSILAIWAFSTHAEPQQLTPETDLHQPSRYAFISDKSASEMAVVDTDAQRMLGKIELKTTADLLNISKDGGFLIYAKKGEPAIHRLMLGTQEQTTIKTKKPVKTLAVSSRGNWIAYTTADSTRIITLKTGKESVIKTSNDVSLFYHSVSNQLFITELNKGKVQRVNLSDGKVDSVEQLFDVNQPISPVSVMPNGIALFFVANGRLQRYALLDKALTPLSVETSIAPLRPYLTSDGRVILSITQTQPTKLLAINAYTYKTKGEYPLSDWQMTHKNNQEFIMTGWLEQSALLADDKQLYGINLAGKSRATKLNSKGGRILDMLVKSDSKTLLMTRQGSNQLQLFDLRQLDFSKALEGGLSQPNHIVMGETNTLCH